MPTNPLNQPTREQLIALMAEEIRRASWYDQYAQFTASTTTSTQTGHRLYATLQGAQADPSLPEDDYNS